jgi:Tfp pilus assembly protein PilV
MSLSMAAMVIFAAIVLAIVMLIRRANREPGDVG